MNILRYRILMIPVLFLVALFVLDKIFLLPAVRKNFLQPGGMTYYYQRELQKMELKEYLASPPAKSSTTAVVFGDSRSFAIGDVVTHHIGRPDWKIYNFAGPQAMPVYHAYLAEDIFAGKHRPDVLILSLSLDSFNRNSGLMFHPNLNWGVSGEFVERYRTMIPARDLERYMASNRYALPGLQFSLKYLMGRVGTTLFSDRKEKTSAELLMMSRYMGSSMEGPELMNLIQAMAGVETEDLSVYSLEQSPHVEVLDILDGAQYAWFGSKSKQELKEETDRITRLYLGNFRVSEEQFFFLQKLLRHARDAGTEAIVVLPEVNPYLYEVYQSNPMIQQLKDRIKDTARRSDAIYYDLNEDPAIHCNQFYDASHLSITCFPPIMKGIIRKVEGR